MMIGHMDVWLYLAIITVWCYAWIVGAFLFMADKWYRRVQYGYRRIS
jgi:hypothetical protein